MDPIGSMLLLLRPWMGYDYTVIQFLCWVKIPEQRRLCPMFVKTWIPINGTRQCGIGSPEIHRNSAVDGLSTGPPDLGRHFLRMEWLRGRIDTSLKLSKLYYFKCSPSIFGPMLFPPLVFY